MARYHKKAATDFRSFRRSAPQPGNSGASILVVAEGESTEPAYFERLRKCFAGAAVELVCHGAGWGDPRALADEALRLRDERRKLARGSKLGLAKVADFDEIWLVFDTDVLERGKLLEGVDYARGKGLRVASSTPCFEFWLLLHGHYTTAPMAGCGEVEPFLKERLGWQNYARQGKKKDAVEKMMEQALDRGSLRRAVENARRVREHHHQADSGFPANPSTDVDLLVSAINRAAGPANRISGL